LCDLQAWLGCRVSYFSPREVTFHDNNRIFTIFTGRGYDYRLNEDVHYPVSGEHGTVSFLKTFF